MKLTISLRNKIHTHTHTHTHTEQCGVLFMGWKLEISEEKEFLKKKKKTLLEPQRRAHSSEEPPDYWAQPTSLVQNLPR